MDIGKQSEGGAPWGWVGVWRQVEDQGEEARVSGKRGRSHLGCRWGGGGTWATSYLYISLCPEACQVDCWQEDKSYRSQPSLAAFSGTGPPTPSSKGEGGAMPPHCQHPGAMKLSFYSPMPSMACSPWARASKIKPNVCGSNTLPQPQPAADGQ